MIAGTLTIHLNWGTESPIPPHCDQAFRRCLNGATDHANSMSLPKMYLFIANHIKSDRSGGAHIGLMAPSDGMIIVQRNEGNVRSPLLALVFAIKGAAQDKYWDCSPFYLTYNTRHNL